MLCYFYDGRQYLLGLVLDRKFIRRPTMAKVTWGIFVVGFFGCLSWIVTMEKEYSEAVPDVTIDWAKPGFGRGFAVMALLRSVARFRQPDKVIH